MDNISYFHPLHIYTNNKQLFYLFDNLVLQDHVSLHEYLGLPDHVRIFISDYSGYRPLPDDVYAYGSRNPVDAGYNAVKALFDTTQARHIVYDSEIHILEKIQQVNYA